MLSMRFPTTAVTRSVTSLGAGSGSSELWHGTLDERQVALFGGDALASLGDIAIQGQHDGQQQENRGHTRADRDHPAFALREIGVPGAHQAPALRMWSRPR